MVIINLKIVFLKIHYIKIILIHDIVMWAIINLRVGHNVDLFITKARRYNYELQWSIDATWSNIVICVGYNLIIFPILYYLIRQGTHFSVTEPQHP